MADTNGKGETFGAWLLTQKDREDSVGDLARAARSDPQFPRAGSPEDVRARLRETMAKGNLFEAVDDAEADWPGSEPTPDYLESRIAEDLDEEADHDTV
ncbi:YozE family protein [Sphingomonas montana]|uniref:YozE family protein n=1 Tax=Sphingomonas montana TaxID=1843236 RepID=UPI00101AD678|nr:YozE family protein [Sphingomonas montana]